MPRGEHENAGATFAAAAVAASRDEMTELKR